MSSLAVATSMNWLAIFCAGVVYWVLGYVWYSFLFGKLWAAELVKYRGERAEPGGKEMGAKLIGTFISNLVTAAAMSYLFEHTGIADLGYAFAIGATVGIGFCGTAITMSYIWDSKPTTLWFIDAGYYIAGSILVALILASWP